MVAEILQNACEFVDVLGMPSFVLSCAADGTVRFEHLNTAHIAVIGLATETVRGKTPHACFPARVAETLLKNYHTCQNSARPFEYEELLDLGGAEMWWQTTLSPVFDDEGTVIGIVGIAQDISARKAREFRRAEVESALRKLNEDITVFTSMTAHDVRGPLTKIASLSELTLDGFADLGDNKRDMIQTMQRVSAGALKHIDGILGYAAALRLGDAETSVIDLGHMCRDIAAVVDPEATMSITTPDQFIDSESVVLQIILRNLAENAMRHAEHRLDISVADIGQGRLRFSVSDDGAGFSGGEKAFKELIVLRQINQGKRGFGLAAVAHLVESRGGAARLDSPLYEQGATVSFDLPGRILWDDEETVPGEKLAC